MLSRILPFTVAFLLGPLVLAAQTPARPDSLALARRDFPEPILIRWVINGNGEIVGMGLGPLSQAPPIDPPK